MFPDGPGNFTCIDSVNAGNAPLRKELVQGILATEIGRLLAPFADDISFDEAIAFKVVFNDAVVPDERVGLQHDLSIIAGVCQSLDVPAHAGRKDQLADAFDIGSERVPLINSPVRQDQVTFLLMRCRGRFLCDRPVQKL